MTPEKRKLHHIHLHKQVTSLEEVFGPKPVAIFGTTTVPFSRPEARPADLQPLGFGVNNGSREDFGPSNYSNEKILVASLYHIHVCTYTVYT